MTFATRSLHTILAITGTLALGVGLLVATASPGSAQSATFTQPDGVLGAGNGIQVSTDNPIAVPGATTQGPAAPYGSAFNVPYDAAIVDVRVDIVLTHSSPDDLDLLLVGPGGQQALVMSDAGGGTDVDHLAFFIDDHAANPLPDSAPLQNTTYRPTDHAGLDIFPAPAPALTGNTSLGIFNGTSAAGVWRLYAMDDAAIDTGTISSWGLTLALEPTPYPSILDVGGLPPVSDVNVTLHGFTSTFPADMDVLLVGPGGQQATVLSDTGSDLDVGDLELTFDDEAASPPIEDGPLVSGTFRPADYGVGVDDYGAGAPVSDGNTELSAFDGISPNGNWRLYFHDDTPFDVSTITGWSLEFSFAETQAPSGSVTIDDGAATTSTGKVTLKLAATDPAPSSGVTQMRFSNDGATFSAYQPYAATTAWTLASGAGTKTVFAQFRDADGNESAAASDTITVTSTAVADTTGPRSVQTSPGARAKGVKASTRVKVKASESVKRGSVTGKTVLLKAKGSSHRVKATLAYRASTHTIVLTPRSHLKHHTTYRVTVKGVRDLAGNTWDQKPAKSGAQALTYRFTTS